MYYQHTKTKEIRKLTANHAGKDWKFVANNARELRVPPKKKAAKKRGKK